MWFAILSFAVYRLVRLWLHDTITEPLRSRAIGGERRTGWCLSKPTPFRLWLLTLLTCQWCLGVWVSFATVGVLAAVGMDPYDVTPRGVTLGVATALGLAAAQSLLHVVELLAEVAIDRLDDDD